MEDGGNVVLPTVAFALSDSVADSVPNGSIESPAAESTPARRSSAKKTKKKKHHRHAKTWDANGRENPRRLRQSGVSAVPSTGIVEQKFLNVSREQQAEFVLSPSLLNDSSFEPRVVQAVTPKYKERTAKKGGNSASGSSSRQRAESGKSTFYAASNRRYSSMNSLHVSSVLHSPDVVEIINCFARALHGNIENSLALAPEDLKLLEIYNEMLHPMNDGPRRKMPSQEVIVDFITRIYFGIALAPENCVMALAYIERLVSLTNVSLHPVTWRRITLSALMLASKVWEDLAVHNKDILRVFPRFSMRDMLELERTFLTDLQFTVTLRASIYAKYYFELRTLSQNESTFPFQPLTNEGAAFLEARSRGAERKLADAKKERRTKSLESLLSSPQERTIGLEEFKQITNKLGAV